jgi:hypothetical protein
MSSGTDTILKCRKATSYLRFLCVTAQARPKESGHPSPLVSLARTKQSNRISKRSARNDLLLR